MILIPKWYHLLMAMTLRLNEEQERALAMLAEAEGVSKHEAVVRAITEAATRTVRDDRVRALSQDGRARYAQLLDRLAQ
jgi:uncharacterized protein (DUF1778 family)